MLLPCLYLLIQGVTEAAQRGRPRGTTFATITRVPKKPKIEIPTPTTKPKIPEIPTIPPQTLRTSGEIIQAMKKCEIIPDLMLEVPENIKPVLVISKT